MSLSSPTRGWRRPLRHRLTVLASAAALSMVGVSAVTGTAYADAHIQITDSADPVTANTPYNYLVTIPDPLFEGGFGLASVDLSGAAATFTGVITSNNASLSCSASGAHAECFPQFNPGTAPITITAAVLPTAAGTVTATTVLEGMGPLGSDSTTTEITGAASAADLTATLTDSPDPVSLGDTVTYTATVTNAGPDNVTGVNATTTLSGAARTIVSATSSQGSCTITAPTITCPLGTLATAAAATITITVQPTATGTLTATTTGSGTEPDPVPTNNTDTENTTINPAPTADIAVTVTGQPHLGILVPYLTYTFTARNTGPGTVTSATLTASLPPGISATHLSAGCSTTTGIVTCTYGTVAAGASTSKSFRVPLHLLSLGHVTVTGVRTTSAPTDTNPTNDTDTATCTVISILLATCP